MLQMKESYQWHTEKYDIKKGKILRNHNGWEYLST